MTEDLGRTHPHEDKQEFHEESESLWRIAFGPVVWAVHFLVSYVAAAIFCARFEATAQTIPGFRIGVGATAVLALLILFALGRSAWRQWDYPDDHDYIHDGARHEDRHEFLGHAALLLVIVSAIGVIFSSLPILMLDTCR